MEKIKKTISLNSLKTYSSNKVSSYFDGDILYSGDEYTSWGKIPVDFIFKTKMGNIIPYGRIINDGNDYEKLINLADTLPFTDGIVCMENTSGSTIGNTVVCDGIVLRYKTMEWNFYLLKNFIKSLRFYRLCERKGEHRWVELVHGRDFEDIYEFYFSLSGDVTMMESLPSVDSIIYCNSAQFRYIKSHTDSIDNGSMYAIVNKKNKFYDDKFKAWNGHKWTDIICIGKNYADIIKKFWVDGKSYEELFYRFVEYVFKHPLHEKTVKYTMSIPYIDIPLCLTQTYDSIGRLRPYVEEWVANKRYYIGDKVIYKTPSDPLGSVYELKKGDFYEYVEIAESVFNSLMNSPSPDSKDLLIEHDKNGIIHFYRKKYYFSGYYNLSTRTTKFDSDEGEHWVLCSNANTGPNELTPTESIGESRISEVERYKRSFDDEGNLLPFVTIKNTSKTELRYLLGNTKMKYNDNGQFYCNVLNSITFMDSERPQLNLIKDMTITSSIPESINTFTDEAKCYMSDNGLIFVFGEDYADGKKHFFSIKSDALEVANKVFEIKVNKHGDIVTTSNDIIENMIPYDILKYGDHSCFSLTFNDKGVLDKAGIGFKFTYGVESIPQIYDVCMGDNAISLNDSSIIETIINLNDMMVFDYTVDKILETTNDGEVYDERSGVNFIEGHKYNTDDYFCNYDGQNCWLEVNVADYPNTAIVEIFEMPKLSQVSYNIIYHYMGKTVTKNVINENGKETVKVFETNKYYIKTSLFRYINIDYDKSYRYDNESGFSEIGKKMAVMRYNSNQLLSEFQDVNGFLDESVLGIQDIKMDVDAYIDRNKNNTASFERHNILGEVNTFDDLSNYRNNYFNL